ncbi:MAG: hypothetical protein WC517_03750 [Patescibacteria group bacterium]
MEREEREIETSGMDIEVITESSVKEMEAIVEKMPRMIEVRKKMWGYFLDVSLDGDWVVFVGKDGKRVCELRGAGAERILTILPIPLKFPPELEFKEESGEDNMGKWYSFRYFAMVTLGSKTFPVESIANSRDKFFGVVNGQFKQIENVSRRDVQTSAHNGLLKNAIKIAYGLHKIPAEILEERGIKLSGMAEFNSGGQGGRSGTQSLDPATPAQLNAIMAIMKSKEMNNAAIIHFFTEKKLKAEITHDSKENKDILAVEGLNKKQASDIIKSFDEKKEDKK